jgi:hypothetical protein
VTITARITLLYGGNKGQLGRINREQGEKEDERKI